jgi:hypothetical protein
MKRPTFFTGQLLTADDFRAEQEYHRGMRRRHNLLCHGFGVVQGLKVSTAKEDGAWTVTVDPGFAIDLSGNEIQLGTSAKLPVPELRTPIQVCIRFVERLCDSGPVVPGDDGQSTQPTRLEEDCEVFLDSKPETASSSAKGKEPGCASDALRLARLVRTRHAWQVIRKFRAPRVH